MSRLYYEIPKNTSEEEAVRGISNNMVPENFDIEKVIKLIPTEVLAAYVTIIGIIPKVQVNVQIDNLKFFILIICASCTPLYMYKMADKNKPFKLHLILSTLAFLVWVYAFDGENYDFLLRYDSAIASTILILFSLICGVVRLDTI